MRDEIRMILGQSQYFGLAVSVAAYLFAAWLRKKTKMAILNPLLISSALIIGCLVCVGMDYETYNKGAGFLGWLLTPATVCLAIPLYRQLNLLRQHGAAVLISILAGVATSAVSVFLLSKALGLGHVHYVTLLPKSITTAIGMGVSEEAGGIVTRTVMSIILTGVLGNMAISTTQARKDLERCSVRQRGDFQMQGDFITRIKSCCCDADRLRLLTVNR